ncbi:MAG: hypothetical protein SXA11_03540 [Cyanobacteriota bacterium]|nr:hypothetical protein [Cyanobacteriota bacterium]
MIAIIKSLFGGKKSSNNEPAPQKAPKQKAQAYFLDNDSAKTLGNIDYMRTAKSVKKSYAQAVGKFNVLSGEVEESISAMEKKAGGISGSVTPTTPSSTSSSSSFSQTPTFQTSSTPRRRASDSGMDSFRQMAKDMKK